MKYFKTECKNLFLSPKRLFYVLVFPLVIFGFFAAIFYKGVPRDLPMAYINYDQSQLSENLLRMLDATPNIDLKIKLTDEKEAQRLIQQQQIMVLSLSLPTFSRNYSKAKINRSFAIPIVSLCWEQALSKRIFKLL